jgi:UDP-galactose transporter B1
MNSRVLTLQRPGGIVCFALAPNSSAVHRKLAAPDAPVRGYLFVFLNLALDAYTNTTQDQACTRVDALPPQRSRCWQITSANKGTTPAQLMFYMNIWCTLYYALFLFAPRGTPLPGAGSGWEAVAFLSAFPEALGQVLLYCCCGAAGQMFIFMAIANFGSVVNITITTTRKASAMRCAH